ncbi:MAG: hypothetical protein Q8K45_04210 [Rubrivivax sp.]|nr:hypothetical protein [Rubrivivax sp.]
MSSALKSSRPSLLKRVSKGFTAFFTHDVEIKRAPEGVQLVLLEHSAAAAKALTREQEAARLAKQELALMRSQLAELLDELPETRHTLRHLVFVEHAIGKHGLKALHKLPVDVMERALSQFEGLVTNWSPVGLASLRSKMAVAIIDRDHRNPNADDEAHRTAAVIDTLPEAPPPEVHDSTDDDALAAAYAALGHLAPSAVEVQGELDSPSARVLDREAARPATRSGSAPDSIKLRELQH